MRTPDRPNLYGVCTGVLIAMAGLLAIVSPTDPDLFWHLKNGEVTLASGFGGVDVFSFTAQGRPWIAHEWLFDVGAHLVVKTFGYAAAVVLSGIVQAVTVWLFVRLMRARGASQALTLAFTAMLLVFIAPSWGVRAQLVTVPLAGAIYSVLLRFKRDPSRPRVLAALPPLMLAWTNLHASFPLGIMIVGIFLVGEVAQRIVYREGGRLPLKPLGVALAACLLATLVNPVGLRLWTYPLPYLFVRMSPVLENSEWHSVDFHEPRNLVYAGTLLLAMIVGLGRPASAEARRRFRVPLRTRIDLVDAALLVVATMMGLRYGRFVSVFGILVLPILGERLGRVWPALSRRAERLALRPKVARSFDFVLGVVVVALFGVIVAKSPRAQLGRAPLTNALFPYPAAAVSVIERTPGARVFSEYVWGGYVLYRLYPNSLVFIDGRADIYRGEVFDDYGAIHDLAPNYRELLLRSGSNFVLLPPDTPLATVLATDPAWIRVFADQAAVLYQRVAGS